MSSLVELIQVILKRILESRQCIFNMLLSMAEMHCIWTNFKLQISLRKVWLVLEQMMMWKATTKTTTDNGQNSFRKFGSYSTNMWPQYSSVEMKAMKGSNSGKHEEDLRWALIKYKICLKTQKPSFNYLNYDITLVWIVNWGHWEVMWHAYYLSNLHVWMCLIWRDLHVHIALTNHRFLLILLISRICLHKKLIVSAWLQTRRGLAIRGKYNTDYRKWQN